MKKLLGISIVAVLAVSPMVASAADPTTPIAPVTVASNETVGVASTKYVKEAYNAMAGAVNEELRTINTAIGNKQDPMSAGKGISITSNKISVDTGSGLDFDGDTDSAKLVVSGLTNAHIASGAAIDQSKISNLTEDLSSKVTNAGQFTADSNSSLIKDKTVVEAIQNTAAKAETALQSNSALNGANLTSGSVQTAALANSAVTADKLDANAVTTVKIDNSAVTADKLGANAVTTVKINNGAVTADKLGAEIQLYSGWNGGAEPTPHTTTVALVTPVKGS